MTLYILYEFFEHLFLYIANTPDAPEIITLGNEFKLNDSLPKRKKIMN